MDCVVLVVLGLFTESNISLGAWVESIGVALLAPLGASNAFRKSKSLSNPDALGPVPSTLAKISFGLSS